MLILVIPLYCALNSNSRPTSSRTETLPQATIMTWSCNSRTCTIRSQIDLCFPSHKVRVQFTSHRTSTQSSREKRSLWQKWPRSEPKGNNLSLRAESKTLDWQNWDPDRSTISQSTLVSPEWQWPQPSKATATPPTSLTWWCTSTRTTPPNSARRPPTNNSKTSPNSANPTIQFSSSISNSSNSKTNYSHITSKIIRTKFKTKWWTYKTNRPSAQSKFNRCHRNQIQPRWCLIKSAH